jgi:Mrp family chromosome partitioning ATPase
MTRIFDALRKTQRGRGAAPFPPPAPLAPMMAAGAAAAVLPPRPTGSPAVLPVERPAPLPAVEVVEVRRLPEGLAREMTTLRIGLEAALEERSRVVLFTSSQRGEGTTTVASQFALLLAADPRLRPVLVDLHARRSAIGPRFGLGAHPAVAGRRSPDVTPSGMAGNRLAVVTMPEEMAERLLYPPALARDLLAALARSYDWVVIDGPPVLEAAEAVELATLAEAVVVVLQAGSTKRPVITRTVELLRKSGARVVGSVLNRRRLEIPEFLYRRI